MGKWFWHDKDTGEGGAGYRCQGSKSRALWSDIWEQGCLKFFLSK